MFQEILDRGGERSGRPPCTRRGAHPPGAGRPPLLPSDGQQYQIVDGKVIIVDEYTGRFLPDRSWEHGLHQAVEAKEHNGRHPEVKIERENQTLATVTFQTTVTNKKLAGMTPGTADTEASRIAKIYNLDVVIPPNRKLHRIENPDLVYRTEKEKSDAIVTEILEEHTKGRPVLVGTVSIEKSEKLSSMLNSAGLKRGTTTGGGADKHVVLNAKYPRTRSRVRRPGRPQRRRHDRHQHGRPPAPTACSAATPSS